MRKKRILVCVFLVGVVILFCLLFCINKANSTNDEEINSNKQDTSEVSESKSEDEKNEDQENKSSAEQTTEETTSNSSTSNSVNENHNSASENTQSTVTSDSSTTNQNSNIERQCVVKKFYSVFRADFDNFDECNKTGKKLKELNGYYGFTCDYQTDDCGDIYYMLTFFDGEGNFIDYPSVPKS